MTDLLGNCPALPDNDLALVYVEHWTDAHSGPGWYSYSVDYPEEGSNFWGENRPTAADLATNDEREATKDD